MGRGGCGGYYKFFLKNRSLGDLNISWPSSFKIRDHTLSMQEGGLEGFCGVTKYFSNILMDHKIFSKIFDGPQNVLFL